MIEVVIRHSDADASVVELGLKVSGRAYWASRSDLRAAVVERFELVIFDCDGVLVDSETVTLPVLRSMLTELGTTLELDDVRHQFGGRSLAQLMVGVAETLGKQPPPTFLNEFGRRAVTALRAGLAPISGVPDLLANLDHPFCTASNAEPEEVRMNLEIAGLLHHFHGRIFGVIDGIHPKPAPDLYLLAARTLGVVPTLCAVVEDSPTGVAAGAAAGMHVFGYAATHPSERLLEAGARETFTSMGQLPSLLAR